MISPNVNSTKVMTPVAIPTPEEPKYCIARTVASADAAVLTRLLPIKIVMINCLGFSFNFNRIFAPGMFCFANVSACNLLTAKNADSAQEKKAEMQTSMTSIIMSKIMKICVIAEYIKVLKKDNNAVFHYYYKLDQLLLR